MQHTILYKCSAIKIQNQILHIYELISVLESISKLILIYKYYQNHTRHSDITFFPEFKQWLGKWCIVTTRIWKKLYLNIIFSNQHINQIRLPQLFQSLEFYFWIWIQTMQGIAMFFHEYEGCTRYSRKFLYRWSQKFFRKIQFPFHFLFYCKLYVDECFCLKNLCQFPWVLCVPPSFLKPKCLILKKILQIYQMELFRTFFILCR